MRIIRLGRHCDIELLEESGCFKGIRSVSIGGVMMRSPRRPMFVEIRNPSGIELSEYRLTEISKGSNETILRFCALREDRGLMELMLHEVRNRYNTTDWSIGLRPADDTEFELILKPVEHAFRGESYEGFSYQYRYRSASIPIYKVLDRSTWEIGGRVEGNTFWLRNGTVDSVYEFDGRPDQYSTEWYLPSIQQPNIFQFFPLQTQMQGFTMTTHSSGTLITRPTEVAHVRSLFEKDHGGHELAHWHEHCGDLAHEFETAPMEVLFHASSRQGRPDLYNVWEAVRDDTWTSLHEKAGLRQERATSYGVIEEWDMPDFDRYLESALPKMLEAGIKTIMLPSEFNNNMNTWGVSNMCCQVDLKVAQAIGPEKFAKFCNTAKASGAKIELWGNTALSTLTYIFNMHNGPKKRIEFLPYEGSAMETLHEARSPWVRNASGAIEADHYTPVFCAMNLRDPVVRDYWNASWKEAHDHFGVDGVFIDSSFNMSSDKFHWVQNDEFDREGGATIDQTDSLGHTRPITPPRQAILSQYPAYIELMADMQKLGIAICGEDVGVFGTSRSGPDVEVRMRSLPLWLDSYCTFDTAAIRRAGGDPDDIYFKGFAYRLVWFIHWDVRRQALSFFQSGQGPERDPTEWHFSILKAFNETRAFWKNRIILPGEVGVTYVGDPGTALWSFVDFDYLLPKGNESLDLLTGHRFDEPVLRAKKHHVYLIEEVKR